MLSQWYSADPGRVVKGEWPCLMDDISRIDWWSIKMSLRVEWEEYRGIEGFKEEEEEEVQQDRS